MSQNEEGRLTYGEIDAIREAHGRWGLRDELMELAATAAAEKMAAHNDTLIESVREQAQAQLDAKDAEIVQLLERRSLEAWSNGIMEGRAEKDVEMRGLEDEVLRLMTLSPAKLEAKYAELVAAAQKVVDFAEPTSDWYGSPCGTIKRHYKEELEAALAALEEHGT